jgi:hypothetical protein
MVLWRTGHFDNISIGSLLSVYCEMRIRTVELKMMTRKVNGKEKGKDGATLTGFHRMGSE